MSLDNLPCPGCGYNVTVQIAHEIERCPECGSGLPKLDLRSDIPIEKQWFNVVGIPRVLLLGQISLDAATAGILLSIAPWYWVDYKVPPSATAVECIAWIAAVVALIVGVAAVSTPGPSLKHSGRIMGVLAILLSIVGVCLSSFSFLALHFFDV